MKELLARFTAYFARLSSLERRFIVIAIVVVFVVGNLWFVLPRFNDWGEVGKRHQTALDYARQIRKGDCANRRLHEPDQQTGKRRRGRSGGRSGP